MAETARNEVRDAAPPGTHVWPESVDRKIQPLVSSPFPWYVAAYSVEGVAGSTAMAVTSEGARPLPAKVQVAPASTDLKRPSGVPTYSLDGVSGSMARALT
jgi:hypothetical protein